MDICVYVNKVIWCECVNTIIGGLCGGGGGARVTLDKLGGGGGVS